MKSVSVKQMKKLDKRAIEDYGIPGIVLMENAGSRTADFIRDKFKNKRDFRVLIVCGRGNNGGDGFVVARHLINRGYSIVVVVLAKRKDISGDALVNLCVLLKMKARVYFKGFSLAGEFFRRQVKHCGLVVDAIFGIGLKRAVGEPFRSYIETINESGRHVIAVDVPSGLNADTGEVLGVAVKATYTMTMGFAKKGFFSRQGPQYTGRIHIIDIGLPKALH